MKTKWLKYLKYLGIVILLLGLAAWILKEIYTVPNYIMRPPLRGELVEMELEHDGHTRTYQAYIPKRLKPNVDIIFVLHASISTGQDIRQQTAYEFDLLAESGEAIIVYPNGFEKHWNDCRKAGKYSANTQNIDDIGFLKKIETALVEKHKVQTAHIFAVGLSNGGHFAYKLALEVPEWLTGVAAIAANLPTQENFDCTPVDSAIAVLVLNGTTDPMNPYNGGEVKFYGLFGSRGTVLSTDSTMNYWKNLANYNGVEPKLMPFDDKVARDESTVTAQLWNDLNQTPIALFTIENGGHTIPHPNSELPKILGTTNKDINAPKEIWSFFQLAKMK